MPAGMKPLEKFLKKQTSALSRAGGGGPGGPGGPGGGPGAADKAGGGSAAAASRRRASLSRVVPFFREPSPEGGQARDVFSPDSEDAPPWPPAAASLNGSACGDARSPSLSSDEQSSDASSAAESAGVHADTPENLMLAVLDSVAGKRYVNCAETLLDDFMLTHPIFLTADAFQQVLLQQFCLLAGDGPGEAGEGPGGEGEEPGEGRRGRPHAELMQDGVRRKRAVLSVAFRYLETYRELLQEEGDKFPKELYVCALQELSRHPGLVDHVVKLERWTQMLHCPVNEEKESRRKQVRPLFRHFRRIDACLQPREAFRGSDEIFCRVYTPDHSYVTIRSRLSCRVGDILALVREKLQYSDERPLAPGKLLLVAVTSAGEKAVFRPSDEAVFTTLGVNTHLFTCQPDELDSLVGTRVRRSPSARLQIFLFPRRSTGRPETANFTTCRPRKWPTSWWPSTGSSSAACTRWSSCVTCSTASSPAGAPSTWSWYCSAAARCSTGSPRRRCSATRCPNGFSCSGSSSRSQRSASNSRTFCPSWPCSWAWTTRHSAD
ncbi:rap guanine nucleotide exchange factor-like 1 isoform X3 [Phyllopteryx taeniolatus]|uniref:rap guanine nucleotide exchange factor-like 1 isoform X3 n=1 Tax=Phyllopteryx taeniolatus TaxID=161469 RepID=UPI002AD469FE|nr:rap guanine nucleotide exchange factor-like 1 isoform X3 [Phyllopteryx taeniolatus]